MDAEDVADAEDAEAAGGAWSKALAPCTDWERCCMVAQGR